jgi:FixJ family two-component response regulator
LGIHIPIVFMTGHADVPMAVKAIKAGAIEFLCKPFHEQELLGAVATAIRHDRARQEIDKSLAMVRKCFDLLSPREREVVSYVVSGYMNKQISFRLGISEITVKIHRAGAMRKMGANSLAELVRMVDALSANSGAI